MRARSYVTSYLLVGLALSATLLALDAAGVFLFFGYFVLGDFFARSAHLSYYGGYFPVLVALGAFAVKGIWVLGEARWQRTLAAAEHDEDDAASRHALIRAKRTIGATYLGVACLASVCPFLRTSDTKELCLDALSLRSGMTLEEVDAALRGHYRRDPRFHTDRTGDVAVFAVEADFVTVQLGLDERVVKVEVSPD